MRTSLTCRHFDVATVVACALTAGACATAYSGLFSHAYPGDTSVYADYGRALVEHGRVPYPDPRTRGRSLNRAFADPGS